MMRRIILLLAVAALMTAMLALASPAYAQGATRLSGCVESVSSLTGDFGLGCRYLVLLPTGGFTEHSTFTPATLRDPSEGDGAMVFGEVHPSGCLFHAAYTPSGIGHGAGRCPGF